MNQYFYRPAIALLLCITIVITWCYAQLGAPNESTGQLSGTLELSGSSTLAPLVMEIGERFEAAHPNVRINVQTGGSSRGIADVSRGVVDIGMSSRPLSDSEKSGRQTWIIATDGVCFLVNRANRVPSLTKAQLVGIFTKRITNWKQVGGVDARIVVVCRAAGRSETTLVSKFLDIDPKEFRSDMIAGENQHGIKLVSAVEDGITFLSLGSSQVEVAMGSKIRLVPLGGVAATQENVVSQTYPLSRPLIFVCDSRPNDLTRKFIRFCQSNSVHDLVQEYSFVPIKN